MLKFFTLFLIISYGFISYEKGVLYTATWYDTSPYPKVHRNYSTAAFNLYNKGDKLLVTNILNDKSDTVVITDRHKCSNTHIDLSKTSFSKIANLTQGRIKVTIIKIK